MPRSKCGSQWERETESTGVWRKSIVSLKLEYVMTTKGTRDIEPLLFGRSRDSYSTIGPNSLPAVDLEAGDRRGNCTNHLIVGRIKGGQRLISLRT
ncbi:hypothetical protein TNCV_2834971 [Trichonephila clavipes]|nr:hypothetical protein TNCV_2834971 [Trichonephila clavipes]